MRIRIGWLVAIALSTLLIAGCNGGGSDDWSDPLLVNFWIGDKTVRSGETVNVPLDNTSVLRFEMDRPFTSASLGQLLSFEIIISNMRNGLELIYTPCYLAQNGDLVWPDESNKIIEYRLNHPLSSDWGVYASPGDTFRVTTVNLVAQAEDDTQIALVMDEFFVVWVESNPGPIEPKDWSDPILESLFIGSVEIKRGETHNVPLSDVSRIRFELSEPVSQPSLTQTFDFEFWIENMDTDSAALITKDNMDANGALYWVDNTNKIIEFRLFHDMSFFWSGDTKVFLGSPGDRYKVTLTFLTGNAEDGSAFNLHGDQFFVVHSIGGSAP